MGLFDKLFGKKEETFDPNHIFAPMAGQTVPVAEVPDPTFAQGILGEGIAIIPADGKVYAPCNATVDTMGGKCFKVHVKNGQKVKKGQLMFEADLEGIKAAGLNTITPVLVCNVDDFASLNGHTGNAVTNDDVVIELSK